MNEPMHWKNKESFGIQTRAPYDDGASKGGDLYFKSGKDACISSNLKNIYIYICTYFLNCCRKILNEVQQDGERSIVVMIMKNRF